MQTLKIETQDIHDALHMGQTPPHYSAAENALRDGGRVVLTNFGADVAEVTSVAQLIELTSLDGPKDHLRNDQSMSAEATLLVESALHNTPFGVTFTVGGKLSDYRRIFRQAIAQCGATVYDDSETHIQFGMDETDACQIDYLPTPDSNADI